MDAEFVTRGVLLAEIARRRGISLEDVVRNSQIYTIVEPLGAMIASRWQRTVKKAPKTFRMWVRAVLILMEEVARCQEQSFDDLAQDSTSLPPILILLEDFAEAVRPRSLTTVLGDLTVFRARVAAFRERQHWTDSEMEMHVKQLWEAKHLITSAATAARLVQHIPATRLRTYADDQLHTLATHFVTWDPLVRFLKDPAAASEVKEDTPQEKETQFVQLRKQLEASLRQRWPNDGGGYSAEDAVQDALLAVHEPEHGYTFEGDFVGWLYTTATHRLRSRWKDVRIHIPLPESLPDEPARDALDEVPNGIQDAPGDVAVFHRIRQEWGLAKQDWPTMRHLAALARAAKEDTLQEKEGTPQESESTDAEVFKRWQERYLLAESFFQKNGRSGVKVIFAHMLLKSKETDVDLAARITRTRETGRAISPITVATRRRRLRQRLEVLRFMLDVVPSGVEKEDTPHKSGLAWALMARLIIDQDIPLYEVQNLVLSLLGTTASPETTRRFNAAHTWIQNQQYSEKMKNFFRETRKSGFGFFLSPCWYLAALQGKSAGDARRVLLPAPGTEEQMVTTIMQTLG